MSKKYIWIVLLLPLLLLAACGGTSPEEQDAVFTQIVKTAMMALTETEAAQPSATPTETATFTPEPTHTPIPTNTPMPVTNTATNSAPAASTCDIGTFVSDVTVPDGTLFDKGAIFTKTWRLKNEGTCTWTAQYQVLYYAGDQMGAANAHALTTVDVAPGETVDISIEMTAPAKNGDYTGYWVLRNADGVNFGVNGAAFYVQIKVGDTVTADTPTPTDGTPGATDTPGPTDTETPTPSPTP